MNNRLLIVFVKNPVLGKVKTRLAASIGDEKALEVYRFLLNYTAQTTAQTGCDKRVFYSDFIEKNDVFEKDVFAKDIQIKGDLGEKMLAAFEKGFKIGYQRIVIIGSDCYELSKAIIEKAFEALEKTDFVIGPAHDGGYYLLGMRQLESAVFKNKKWSQDSVYQDTIQDLKNLNYTYTILPILNDIDVLEDLPTHLI